MLFQCYSSTVAINSSDETELILWCLNEKSETCAVRVKNPPIFLHFIIEESNHEFTDDTIKAIKNKIKFYNSNACEEAQIKVKSMSYDKKFMFYNYSTEKKTCLKISFKNEESIQLVRNLFRREIIINNDKVKFSVLDYDIPTKRKLFTKINLKYSDWFELNSDSVQIEDENLKLSSSKYEFVCAEENISKSENQRNISYPTMLSFDIETYSNNHKSMPNMDNPDHVCYMVSCIFQKVNDKSSRQNYIIVIGDSDEIPNSTIIKVKNEKELFREFIKLVNELDPIIMTGYNIFGYDYEYMNCRYKYTALEEWPNLSKLKSLEISTMENIKWKSSAYGFNVISFLKMPGRISIDMLPIVKRDYKLDKYSLNFVAEYFLKQSKHNVSAADMFKIYELCQELDCKPEIHEIARKEMTRVIKYCIQDAVLVVDLFDKLNTWIAHIEMASITGTEIVDLFTRGQQIRCLSQVYDLATKNNVILDRKPAIELDSYQGGFVGHPIPGIHDNVICLDFASLYPSIMIAYNICHSTYAPLENRKISDENCEIIEFEKEAILKLQEDEDEFCGSGDKIRKNPDSDSDSESDSDDTKSEKHTGENPNAIMEKHRFIKQEVRIGIIPQLLTNLISERNNVKKQMKTETDEIYLIVLDKRQLALKVSANSLYGFLGAKKGVLPFIQAAMCVTSIGRQSIIKVNKYMEDTYDATIVYNDTDSSMFVVPGITAEECYQKGLDLAVEVSSLFKDPIRMEFEKAMRIFCLKKKMYAAFYIEKDGSIDENDVLIRGIVLQRRDNFKFLKTAYMELLKNCLRFNTLKSSLEIVKKTCIQVFNGDVDINNLVYIKQLGSNYKNPNFPMAKFAVYLKAKGKNVIPGDRLEYILVNTKDNAVKAGDKMRDPILFKQDNEGETIDFAYYIEKGLKSLDQLIKIGYPAKSYDFGYTPYSKTKRILKLKSIYEPTKMIGCILSDFAKYYKNEGNEVKVKFINHIFNEFYKTL